MKITNFYECCSLLLPTERNLPKTGTLPIVYHTSSVSRIVSVQEDGFENFPTSLSRAHVCGARLLFNFVMYYLV